MTRKDYVLIADALKLRDKGQPVYAAQDMIGATAAIYRLADALARDNPKFDRDRFLKASGVQS